MNNKQVIRDFILVIFLCIASIAYLACGSAPDKPNKAYGDNETEVATVDTMQVLRSAIAQSFDIPADSVFIQDTSFIIYDDGVIDYTDALLKFGKSLNPDYRPGAATGATQMMSYYKVNTRQYPVVKIYCDSTVVPRVWINALDSAIANFNGMKGIITYKRVFDPYGATTKVATTNAASSTIATAAYPDYYGRPGNRVTINTYQNDLPESKRIHAVFHELMHLIGFSHTNGTFGSLVTGTPVNDPKSVMNSIVQDWIGLTNYDTLAINSIYK